MGSRSLYSAMRVVTCTGIKELCKIIIFKRIQNIPIIMGWEQTISTEEFICYEKRSKAISVRIESRKTEDGWHIYKSYFNDRGLNHTEEYLAPTIDKMQQVIQTLQDEKPPSIKALQELMLEKSRKVHIKLERDFKEYNVEKWRFSVNHAKSENFCLVRCYDEIDLDIVLHESLKMQEKYIVKEIINTLGFDDMEDLLNIQCYYFNKRRIHEYRGKDKELEVEFL